MKKSILIIKGNMYVDLKTNEFMLYNYKKNNDLTNFSILRLKTTV